MHWILERKKSEENFVDAVKSVLIPLYMGLLTMFGAVEGFGFGDLMLTAILVGGISVVILIKARKKIDFGINGVNCKCITRKRKRI